jgi:hypothetical protein
LLQRGRALLPGLWAGMLLCLGALATPAPFALLPREVAGRVAGRMLAGEAYASLVLTVMFVLIERRLRGAVRPSAEMLLALGALFCTVAGYFAVLPMMEAARAGQGLWPFAVLHAVSSGFFVLKGVLVLVLAWRVASPAA